MRVRPSVAFTGTLIVPVEIAAKVNVVTSPASLKMPFWFQSA